jgi:hypothetical protein
MRQLLAVWLLLIALCLAAQQCDFFKFGRFSESAELSE